MQKGEDLDEDFVGNTHADENYRVLKEGIDAMRDQAEMAGDSDEDGENPEQALLRKRTRKEAMEQDVLRTRAGIILPAKNGFDFVEKPKSRVQQMQSRGQGNKQSGMENLRKALLKMNKKGKSHAANSKMQIVKNDIC